MTHIALVFAVLSYSNILQDAMHVAIENQDRGSQSYSMLCFADIHRVRKDTDRAIPRYNSASGMMMETGDQFGNALVALGKAKAYFRANEISRVRLGRTDKNFIFCD